MENLGLCQIAISFADLTPNLRVRADTNVLAWVLASLNSDFPLGARLFHYLNRNFPLGFEAVTHFLMR